MFTLDNKFKEYGAEIIQKFTPKQIIKTGSRVFGDATETSDYDFVLLVEEKDLRNLISTFEKEGYEVSGDQYDGEDFIFFRKMPENINLIITNNPINMLLWSRCNNAAQNLSLSKDDRSLLFSSIVDGE